MVDPGMDDGMLEYHTKKRRDEEARERRKWWKEEDIWADKREHSLSLQVQIWRSEGFYSENWGEDQQEADD